MVAVFSEEDEHFKENIDNKFYFIFKKLFGKEYIWWI